jgi:hypothetical protein
MLPQAPNLPIRISFFFTKHPSLSRDDFYTYWRETHGRLAIASNAFRAAKMTQYTQVRDDAELQAKAQALGMQMLEHKWDASSEMYVASWEDYLRFATSAEMAEVLGPDGAKFMDVDAGLKVLVTRVDDLYVASKL